MCSWPDLIDGTITLIELVDMHRSMNLQDYLEEQSRAMQKGE